MLRKEKTVKAAIKLQRFNVKAGGLDSVCVTAVDAFLIDFPYSSLAMTSHILNDSHIFYSFLLLSA